MSATDELRKLLDERGVEWGNVRHDGSESDYFTEWCPDGTKDYAAANEALLGDGLTVKIIRGHLTPEQAIAVTLGNEQEVELQKALNKAAGNWARTDAELRKALDFMQIWISEDAHLGESAISREFEKAEGLRKLDAIRDAIAATLEMGTCRNIDGDYGLYFECSECGCHALCNFYSSGYGEPRFCPGCGRKVERG